MSIFFKQQKSQQICWLAITLYRLNSQKNIVLNPKDGDDIIPILRNSTFLITSIILWSIYYYVYSYTGILPQFGETHNAVFGITLPWIVMGIAYKFNIRFKYDISYGIYLYHMPIIQLLIDFTQKNSSCLPIVWILVILLSSISCIFIERPFIKLKSSFQWRNNYFIICH